MSFFRSLFCGAALLCTAVPAHSAGLDANEMMRVFNNIVLGNLNAPVETEGALFVGGDYSGGSTVNPHDHAPVDFGGAAKGTFFVGGDVLGNPNVNHGDAIVGGAAIGTINTNDGDLHVGVAGIPVAEMRAAMLDLSDRLSMLPNTGGTAHLSDNNNYRFDAVADATGTAVFNIDAGWMSVAGTLHGVFAAPGVTTVINVSGTDITINPNANASFSDVVFNFFEAQNIQLNSAFNYSILAPRAHINLQGGGVNGTVVSASMQQGAEVRPPTFTGTLPGVVAAPLPAAAPMLLGALAGFGLIARRRRG